MDIEIVKKLITKYESGHAAFAMRAAVGERYYRNRTDVLLQPKKDETENENELRNADNRIPRNYHGLLVNQKASYAFTTPPTFDVGNKTSNARIEEVLGDDYRKNCTALCVNAANTGVGWIHYWRTPDGKFDWAVCPSADVIPIFDGSLKNRMIGAMREYHKLDEDTGERYVIYEFWSDTTCEVYQRREAEPVETVHPCMTFHDIDTNQFVNAMTHGLGAVPFIPFWNNNIHESDLDNIKPLIDVYDKVFSGFINDLDDVQELIFVLSGYGGQDLKEFLQDLKKYKAIKIDTDTEQPGGVQTLSIEIPIEARNSVLDATRKAIFEQGFGFDPQPENFGNQSGVALKFMYALLEMKVGLMETEFQSGFNAFIRAICRFYGLQCGKIIQTWTRTAIRNEQEQAQICQQSVGIISTRTILKNHPFVEDVDQEIKELDKENDEKLERQAEYGFLDDAEKPEDDDRSEDDDKSDDDTDP